MKHIPLILAILIAALLTFCWLIEEPTTWMFYEGPHSWWQSDFLGNVGFWMKMPTLGVTLLVSHLAGLPLDFEPSQFTEHLILFSPFITIALIALVVFYITKALLRFIKPNNSLQATAAAPASCD